MYEGSEPASVPDQSLGCKQRLACDPGTPNEDIYRLLGFPYTVRVGDEDAGLT